MAFKAIVHFRFGVQSHCISFVSAFRAVFSFLHGVQSRCLFSVSAFRAMFSSFRRLEPSLSLLSLMIRVVFSSGVQSHYVIHSGISELSSHLRSAFRAITYQYQCSELSSSYFQLRHSEPSLSLLSLMIRVVFSSGAQSHYVIHSGISKPSSHLRSAFRAITHQYQCSELSLSYFQFRRSKPSLLLLSLMFRVVFSSGVQSHYVIHSDVWSHVLLRSAFRAIVHFRFGVQSHCILFVSAFRVTSSFRRSEPLFVSFIIYLVFRIVVLVRHSKSSCISFIRSITIFLLSGF